MLQIKRQYLLIIYKFAETWASTSILADHKIKARITFNENARLVARVNFNKCYKRYQHQISLSRMNIPHKDAILDILSKYKIPYDKGHATIIATCPSSCRLADSSEKCVYINKVTGSFVCKRCEKRGQWQDTKGNQIVLSTIARDTCNEYKSFRN